MLYLHSALVLGACLSTAAAASPPPSYSLRPPPPATLTPSTTSRRRPSPTRAVSSKIIRSQTPSVVEVRTTSAPVPTTSTPASYSLVPLSSRASTTSSATSTTAPVLHSDFSDCSQLTPPTSLSESVPATAATSSQLETEDCSPGTTETPSSHAVTPSIGSPPGPTGPSTASVQLSGSTTFTTAVPVTTTLTEHAPHRVATLTESTRTSVRVVTTIWTSQAITYTSTLTLTTTIVESVPPYVTTVAESSADQAAATQPMSRAAAATTTPPGPLGGNTTRSSFVTALAGATLAINASGVAWSAPRLNGSAIAGLSTGSAEALQPIGALCVPLVLWLAW